MEYAQMVVYKLDDNRKLSESAVMSTAILNIIYMTHLLSEAHKVMENFSYTRIEPRQASDFNAELFLLYMKFQNHDIDEETYYEEKYKIERKLRANSHQL